MKYHITIHGCQMNKSDAERVAGILEEIGYSLADKESEADLAVVVACSVRQAAVHRIYGRATEFLKLKKKNSNFISILTGCVLEKDKKKLKEKFDYVFSIKDIGKLKSELKKVKNNKLINDYFSVKPSYSSHFSAFVPIMTGCNNFCSYCAVPYVRGREKSRKAKDILEEIGELAKKGYLEITLLGQNVNTYRPSDKKSFSKSNPYKDNFAALLWEINNIEGIVRIFFTAPHPKDMSDEVIKALALPKMLNYLHLPVQSGDNEILKKMNRNYTREDYLKLIGKIKKVRPDIALGTDFIVGFPGETKEQFDNTIDLYKEVGLDISYHAMYSPREGTMAAKFADDVTHQEKRKRWSVIQKLMEELTLEKNQKYVNKVVSVLVDRKEKGWYVGNSREMKQVRLKGDGKIGKIFNVKINKAYTWILEGNIVYEK